ncbi:hypothetical protein NHJ13734_007527 [Beauveria thailandica]
MTSPAASAPRTPLHEHGDSRARHMLVRYTQPSELEPRCRSSTNHLSISAPPPFHEPAEANLRGQVLGERPHGAPWTTIVPIRATAPLGIPVLSPVPDATPSCVDAETAQRKEDPLLYWRAHM